MLSVTDREKICASSKQSCDRKGVVTVPADSKRMRIEGNKFLRLVQKCRRVIKVRYKESGYLKRKYYEYSSENSVFLVITISVAVLLAGGAVGILYVKVGLPKAMAGLGFLGIAGFGGLGPLIFRKDKGAVECDERDILINRQAALAGFGVAYMVVGLACMVPFFILGTDSSISVSWLPMIFMGAGLSSFFTHSVAILVQYGRGGKGEKS